jgi:hypothetical protein
MPRPKNTIKIHYSGGLRIFSKLGGVTELFAGYACCAYGDHAKKIVQDGNQTEDPSGVTCAKCLKHIDRARANGVVGTGDHSRINLDALGTLLGAR